MNTKTVAKILSETAFCRISCTESERKGAEYIKDLAILFGVCPRIEKFPIISYTENCAQLFADEKEIKCKSCFGTANASLCAPFYYMPSDDDISLKKSKGKIVLTDKYMTKSLHDGLVKNGAAGFITYSGNLNFPDADIDRREIRFESENSILPGVHINVRDAVELVKKRPSQICLKTDVTQKMSESYNVIADIKGTTDETVVVCAHYDTTENSFGAYDNMTGCIALLYLAEYFKDVPLKRNLRLLWCGSEERGLWGSKAYCKQHKEELEKTVLNINLDMLGSLMGTFTAFSCADENMLCYLEKLLKKHRFSGKAQLAIRSSDQNCFIDCGVPAVSFARYAPSTTAFCHTRYDTKEVLDEKTLVLDMEFVAKFARNFVCNEKLPVKPAICEKIAEDVRAYMAGKKDLLGEI